MPPGLAVAGVTPAGGVVCWGGVSIFTSLGTITPLPLSGTAGSPASADVGTLPGVCGGGSLTAFGPQAPSQAAPPSTVRSRHNDLILIRVI